VARRLGDQRKQEHLEFGLIEQPLAATATGATSEAATKTAAEAAPEAFPAATTTPSSATGEAVFEPVAIAAERSAGHAEAAAPAHAVFFMAMTAMSAMAASAAAPLHVVFHAIAHAAITAEAAMSVRVVDVSHFISLVSHDGHKIYLKSIFARR
jgi:hypothetical protein